MQTFEEHPYRSLYDITKAKEILGFNPEYGWR